MQDYSISKCTRKCSVSGRSLEPGETYISAIVPDGDTVRRIDIASQQWQGPGDETIGWWKCRMPAAAARKRRPAPAGVLLDTLSELLERPGKESNAYLLALLLVRRRVLADEESIESSRFETSARVDDDEPQQTFWSLVCPADGRQWNVPVMEVAAAELDKLQAELNELLFTEE